MSEELNKELTKLISKAAIDGTLSESAVNQFTDVLEDNKSLKAMLASSEEQRDKGQKVLEQCVKDRDSARDIRGTFKERIESLDEREKEITRLELHAEYSAIRVSDHIEMVSLIFRNSILRTQMMTPGHPGHVDQYGTVQNQAFETKHDLESKET